MRTFIIRMQPLCDSLACILIQCPKTLVVTVAQLEQIKLILDEDASSYNGQIAIEFRNVATYFDKQIRSFLSRSGYALVMHPNSLGRSTCKDIGTLSEYKLEDISQVASLGQSSDSSFVYMRLHGSNNEHLGEYSIDQLEEIAKQIHTWRLEGLDVFCFILNDLEPTTAAATTIKKCTPGLLSSVDKWCAMPKNAKQLESCVYGLSNEEIPAAPKKPKHTMHSYFGKKEAS